MNFPGIDSITKELLLWKEEMFSALRNCNSCPHRCGVDRVAGQMGVCRTGAGFSVSSLVLHQGEEPVISGMNGICNVFFTHCNLQCKFCQNHQISNNKTGLEVHSVSLEDLLVKIIEMLDNGTHGVGFVSPSHVFPQVKILIKAIKGLRPDAVIIYNTNGYDNVSELASLEGLVDVWLPDFKYMDAELGKELSGVKDYPDVARAALKEMFRQKGTSLILDPAGFAVSGLIVRHLVIPSAIPNSLEVLRFLADELSPRIWISVMSQYNPVFRVKDHPDFGRKVRNDEYEEVVNEMEKLGLHRGWLQGMDSPDTYLPDFQRKNPFE